MGAAVTEMVRTFLHRPFRLDEHLDRLMRGVHSAGFPQGIDPHALREQVLDVIRHNAVLLPAHEDLGVVVFVTAGKNLTYLGAAGRAVARQPTQCVHSFPLPCELWASKMTAGQHLVVPSVRQIPAESMDPRIKSRSRMHWYLADQQARLVDEQAAALVVDRNGNIAETSTGNVFVVKGRVLQTPSPHLALDGVSQQVVKELAAQVGLGYRCCALHPVDVLNADEVFTSSTPYCVMPVTRFNGQPIGSGRSGPVFASIVGAWNNLVGLDIIGQIEMVAAARQAAR
ncbi:MAG: aminotransferase class IV [Planctomycetaceae bacterium]